MDFCHLHCHSEFSLLDGAARVSKMVEKAKSLNMEAVGISDHGNMYAVPKFSLECKKHNIKPIIGSEFYLAGQSRFKKSDRKKENEQNIALNPTYHQILFAKNEIGYKNLMKLSSLSFIDGYHYNPRIDKEILEKYSDGLIATTCCIASEINQAILRKGESYAEQVFLWYLNLFGKESYYIEIQDHGLDAQKTCNKVLLKWSKKYDVKLIATNDVHYVEEEESEAHDLLLALQTNSEYKDPNRFRFVYDYDKSLLNKNFYFKSSKQMMDIDVFSEYPESLSNTIEIADKCSFELSLNGDLFLPAYSYPSEFDSMDDYLRFLSFNGARKRYGDNASGEIYQRIDTELSIIKKMGFSGYFLIVQDFTNEARKRGVIVGPGRGSAAGSVVAYCIGIVDIDPLKYDLLFERFLNPERISPPDIDIDFDDEGRQKVIDYVLNKYGSQNVAQIITYGTMGAKTAIRDVGRVLGVPIKQVNKITKYMPEKQGFSLEDSLDSSKNPDGYQYLNSCFNSKDESIYKTMLYAKTLEGTARHTGVHAAGIIIAPDNVQNYVPVSINNTKERIITTQFDGPMCELSGLLKMDFLGLRTLSIIKSCIEFIKENKNIDILFEDIPLNDKKTFELYQKGDTIGTFQFESDGLRKFLTQLKPTTIEDLIAMNALYRPGPIENIPSFIRRKNGEEEVEYPHQMLENILSNTYGIMVYQEQIMQTAQKMAGYSLSEADLLRRAMGKKKVDVMKEEKIKFINGAKKNNVLEEIAIKTFSLMEKFAMYGFNKSHSAAYSILAFKTAYLKAHYPVEYMCSVLKHNKKDVDKLSFFMTECRKMGINILQPNVNESFFDFSINKDQEIVFGLSAIKGVGENLSIDIVKSREKEGKYKSFFDFCKRINHENANKKNIENLAYSGSFDCFGYKNRGVFVKEDSFNRKTGVDIGIEYGKKESRNKKNGQGSLFDSTNSFSEEFLIKLNDSLEIESNEILTKEKEVTGFYLSSHPLDKYLFEINHFNNVKIKDIDKNKGKNITICAVVSSIEQKVSKYNGNEFGIYKIEDYESSFEFLLFKEKYQLYKNDINIGDVILLNGFYLNKKDEDDCFFDVNKIMNIEDLLNCKVSNVYIKCSSDENMADIVNEFEKISFNNGRINVIINGHVYKVNPPIRNSLNNINGLFDDIKFS